MFVSISSSSYKNPSTYVRFGEAFVLEQHLEMENLCSSQYSCFKPVFLLGGIVYVARRLNTKASYVYLERCMSNFCVT